MNKRRFIRNITPNSKHVYTKMLGQSPERIPSARPMTVKAYNFRITSQPKSNNPHVLNFRSRTPENRANLPDTKNGKLLEQISILNKEKNEIMTNSRKEEVELKVFMNKLKDDNQSLKSAMHKIIPLINQGIDPNAKLELQKVLKNDTSTEYSVQCNIIGDN